MYFLLGSLVALNTTQQQQQTDGRFQFVMGVLVFFSSVFFTNALTLYIFARETYLFYLEGIYNFGRTNYKIVGDCQNLRRKYLI